MTTVSHRGPDDNQRRGPWYFVCFLLAAVTFMGLFISPSVLFVAFMPFLEDIFTVLEVKKGGKTGNMIMMGTAFCISLSSGMTAIGHVWPTMAIGYYAAATGRDINQFQFMAFGIPIGVLLIALLILVFKFIYRPDDINDIDPKKAMSLRGIVPPADRKEMIVLGTMFLVVLLWVGPSLIRGVALELYSTINGWTTAMPPLLGCIILFIVKDNRDHYYRQRRSPVRVDCTARWHRQRRYGGCYGRILCRGQQHDAGRTEHGQHCGHWLRLD